MKNIKCFKLLPAMLLSGFMLTNTSVFAQSPPSGDHRVVAPYHNLEIEGAFTVALVQGNQEAVNIEAVTELAEQIITKVDDGTLKIITKKHSNVTGNISITVYFKNLKSIDCAGSVLLNGSGPLTFEDLSVDISGACKTTLEISATSLHVDISGAGNAALNGKALKVGLDISGAGKFMAAQLLADEYQIDISGAGNAEVHAAKELDVDVSGSGNLKYAGEPKISKEISGSGRVVKM